MTSQSPLTMPEYLSLSGRTAAEPDGNIRPELYPLHSYFGDALIQLVYAGAAADLMKRAVFYKEAETKMEQRNHEAQMRIGKLSDALINLCNTGDQHKFSKKEIDLIHAQLGLISEAAESLEEILSAFSEARELDVVNLKEESGDKLWYQALELRALDTTFEAEATKNIAKLSVRYPEKFTAEAALNRNLEEEKKTLSA